MLRHLLLAFFLFQCIAQLAAQSTLFVPRNYQKSYAKGTRSWDGKPGARHGKNPARKNPALAKKDTIRKTPDKA